MNALSAQNGRRVTSSDAYLSPVPSNLTILTDLMVERVIFDGEKAVGIEGAEKKSKLELSFCVSPNFHCPKKSQFLLARISSYQLEQSIRQKSFFSPGLG